jgi:hypothetical protein
MGYHEAVTEQQLKQRHKGFRLKIRGRIEDLKLREGQTKTCPAAQGKTTGHKSSMKTKHAHTFIVY